MYDREFLCYFFTMWLITNPGTFNMMAFDSSDINIMSILLAIEPSNITNVKHSILIRSLTRDLAI